MEELLAFWDRAYGAIALPHFGNLNIDYLGFRLEVYRQEDGWRLWFHLLVWHPAAERAVAIPPGLEPLLVLTEGDHSTEESLPSQTETFPRLAEVRITGDRHR